MRNRTFLNTKNIFLITLIVVLLTILLVWQFDLGKHNSIIENSLLSTIILSSVFFCFLSYGLFKGVKLKDDIGKITDQFDWKKIEELKNFGTSNTDVPEVGDGIVGVIFGVLLWLLISFIISFLFYLFGAFIWMTILIFMAMLYWIFFRALRLVFKKSPDCKGQLDRSMMYSLFYTCLYTFWIFGVIYIASKY